MNQEPLPPAQDRAQFLQTRIDSLSAEIEKYADNITNYNKRLLDPKEAERHPQLNSALADAKAQQTNLKEQQNLAVAQLAWTMRGGPTLKFARIEESDQPRSNAFLRFIQVLPKGENKDGFLNFTEAWWGRGEAKVPLLVRDCYAFFYDTLLQKYDSRSHLNMVLTGTPGTGKSAFGLYAVWRLVTEEKLSVLYEVKDSPAVLFASKPMEQLGVPASGMYEVELSHKPATIRELCDVKELVRVQDPIDGAAILVPGSCFNLIVSSPDEAKLKILSKDEARTILLYMDLWSEEEMVLAAKEMKTKGVGVVDLDEEAVREKYKKYGGSAREIFNPDADVNFEKAMRRADRMDITDLLSMDKQKGDLSAMLVHYAPVLPERLLTHVIVASPLIASMLIEKYKVRNYEQLKSFVASYKEVKDLQGFRGTVMHDVLMKGGKFQLEDGSNQNPTAKVGQVQFQAQ
ncbi:hypothetical protein BASA81_007347 [Batrachochytrium salamandrivorans]|nr:hypothetical protein BASA81_007347 [Batrachochytrium salamandrivorans]